ncbi:MAG: hypothetical protein ACKO23_16840 [Gemmataceae bacterium]
MPYPDADARREIIRIYDGKMSLKMTDEALDYAVKRTGDGYLTPQGTPFSGDHLNALCRSIARIRLREHREEETTPHEVERAITEYDEKLNLTPREEKLLATHEAGHFIVALNCPNHPAPERITIHSEVSWAPAYVRFKQDETRRLGLTRNQMLDDLCVLLGGIEAERLLLEDVSTGAGGSDLVRATILAHLIVETYGMSDSEVGLRQYRSPRDGERYNGISEEHKVILDREVNRLIRQCQERAATILRENRDPLLMLRDEVISRKTIESTSLKELMAGKKTAEDEPAKETATRPEKKGRSRDKEKEKV